MFAGPEESVPMIDQKDVQAVIDEIRPMLQADGGDIDLVEVRDDGVVRVKLKGACAGCPGARMTLQMGVERRLREKIPEVTGVEAVNFD
jgi:Fe-S cluster biogenesis protein NfuA